MSTNNSTKSKIVALLSDFGYTDCYVGVMKGVILSLDAGIRIIDLTHQVEPQDILSGAYLLYSAWSYLPPGTVFCAVVDPGVGSGRGTVFAEMDDRCLVAPDNGLISLLARMIPGGKVYALDIDSILELTGNDSTVSAHSPSSTFHGRDLFAPAAALCALGSTEKIRGPAIDPVLLPEVVPEHDPRGISGHVLHIDRFGNCISSVHGDDLAVLHSQHQGAVSIKSGEFIDNRVYRTYADVPAGTALCLIGSSGFLEIAVREGSAAQRFGITSGQTLRVGAIEP
jgi:hypothetical protein